MFSQYNVELQARARQQDIQRDARRGSQYAVRGPAQPARSAAENRRLLVALGGAAFAVLLAALMLAALAHAGAGLPVPL